MRHKKTISEFLTDLSADLKHGSDRVWIIREPLIYRSKLLDTRIIIPAGFETDFASVPRVPIAYQLWGNRAHREATLHDYLYRKDAVPDVTCALANEIFFEAMGATGKPKYIQYPMWWGVVLGGWPYYKKRSVRDTL